MENKNNFTIRKIPLQGLLTLLNDLYEKGADYIDIHGEIDDKKLQDNITIAVPIDYMSEEDISEDLPPEVEDDKIKTFTDEYIKNLIDNV